MDVEKLEKALSNLQERIKFHVVGFGQKFIPFPAPFSDVARLNKFNHEKGSVVLKQLLNQPKQKGRGVKRKLENIPESLTSMSDQEDEELDFEIDFSGDAVKLALERLNNCLKKDNLQKLEDVFTKSTDEGELEIGLGIHLISKLAGNASTSPTKSARSCPCGCGYHLDGNEKMWIGSENTWYGELDLIAGNPASGDVVSLTMCKRPADVVSDDEDNKTEGNDDDDDSRDDCTNVEVKYELQRGLNQIVAQAIVFGFTEVNRHTNLGHFIPSVWIKKTGYIIAIYNPVADICLLSNFVAFGGSDSTSKVAFFLLWIILNHRTFFRKNTPKILAEFSHFHEKVNSLENFQMLRDYSKRISQQWCCKVHEEGDTLVASDMYQMFDTL